MIVYLKGDVLSVHLTEKDYSIDILTGGGVGYRVSCPVSIKKVNVGEKIEVFTYMYVREDRQALYGFESAKQKELFELLISVSGVGPKVALSIMSSFSVAELFEVISTGNDKYLSTAPGLGKKLSKKIILDLQGKIDAENTTNQNISLEYGKISNDLESALRSLGFTGKELKVMVDKGAKLLRDNRDYVIEDLIRDVLNDETN